MYLLIEKIARHVIDENLADANLSLTLTTREKRFSYDNGLITTQHVLKVNNLYS